MLFCDSDSLKLDYGRFTSKVNVQYLALFISHSDPAYKVKSLFSCVKYDTSLIQSNNRFVILANCISDNSFKNRYSEKNWN